MTGRIDPAFVVHETAHWIVNHRVDATLPGYLMVAARDESAALLSALSGDALAEIGPLLATVTRTVEQVLGADRVYVGRYGHSTGWPIHFHLIPVYGWLVEAFERELPYDAVRRLHGSTRPGGSDGADLTLYVWREWTMAEGRGRARAPGPSIADAIDLLRASLAVS